jgi:hypothetical protein
MDSLVDAWKNLESKSIHRGWAIYEDNVGGEMMKEREKRKSAFRDLVSVENYGRKNVLFQAFNG